MSRHALVRRPVRVLLLSSAISMALWQPALAQSNPFARRGADPGAQAARTAQQQGLQSGLAGRLGQKSLQAFQRAAQARSALDAAQAAARAAAAASSIGNDVPDGLGKGGLQMVDGVIVDPGAIRADDPRLGQSNVWLGAKRPTQNVVDGQTNVTIEQTQNKAILNWETFNVGKNTHLKFDQSAGGSQAGQWIALNRVNDPDAAPSRILGSIEAQGQVYVLNRNGVIFGGTSQVNTRSLLVSSLDLFTPDLAASNTKFIASGLFGPDVAGSGNAVLTGVESLQAGGKPGDIRIDSGARIASGTDGYTLIAAPNLSNAGSVSAKDGQVVLAAVTRIQKGTIFNRPASNQLPINFENGFVGANSDYAAVGVLENTGVVSSTRGDAMLVGYDLRQHGVVTATTSISRPGSIALLAIDQSSGNSSGTGSVDAYYGGKLDLGTGSVTSLLPEFDGETTTSGSGADRAFLPPSMTLLGTQVRFNTDSLVLAPGARVDIFGRESNLGVIGRAALTNRIWMDTGAVLNVAGLADVKLGMDANLVTIPRVGQNELADSPLQRDGALFRRQVVFDRRDSGVREDGLAWVGSPLLNALGYVDQVPRKIDELLLDGGDVNITAQGFVMNNGARIDLDGGFLHFLGGIVETQRLVGTDGRLYDLATADPSRTYLGFAGEQRISHSRWNVTQTFNSPLVGSRRYYESDYAQGGDAGTLNIKLTQPTVVAADGDTLNTLILDGDLSAQALSGRYQTLFGNPAKAGALTIATPTGVRIANDRAGVPDSFGIDTPVSALPGADRPPQDPSNPAFWSTLSTDFVADAGLATVNLDGAIVVSDAGSRLQVADGGRIGIDAGRIDLQGALVAHAGTIDLKTAGGEAFASVPGIDERVVFGKGDIVLGADARLDVSGRWINDSRLQVDAQTGKAFIDGGSISLLTQQRVLAGADGIERDASGSILLAPGAVLDASGGGYVNPDGQLAMRDGVPLGRGGDIALQTYVRPPGQTLQDPTYVVDLPTVDDRTGLLDFQGADLRADSFAGGGTLTLRALGVQIGGAAPEDARILHLGADFFDGKGFGGYDLSAEQDATIVAGTDVRVSQRNLIPDFDALRGAATGTDLHAGLGDDGRNAYVSLGTLDAFHRPATDFSLRAGDYLGRVADNPSLRLATGTFLLDRGASLTLDAGADVRLGSRGQLTVLGDITAHGGSITLSGDTDLDGVSPPPAQDASTPYFTPGKSVWVGAESRLDVSGIALIDPTKPLQPTDRGRVQPRDGVVLDGGRITLTNDGGYVVVEQGAQLDLSGARDAFDLPSDAGQLDGGSDTLVRRNVWSDGGTLTLASAGGLFFDGELHAAGGDAQARGGTLALLPLSQRNSTNPDGLSATGIVFEQSGSRLPDAAAPGAVLEPDRTRPSGLLYFAADRLDGSGIDTLVAGNQAPQGGDSGAPLVPIAFAGDVDLSVARALVFNAPLYTMIPAGSSDLAAAGADNRVRLGAAYVGLNGFRPFDDASPLPTLAQPGATSLEVRADFIDLGGQLALSNVGTADFTSRGDIRFHTPAQYAFLGSTNPLPRPGELLTAGDLNFTAAQLYPASGETFLVRALGAADPDTGARAATRITISPNGDSVLPLSAGGTLAFDASDIVQNGTVRAPSGRIVLGVGETDSAAARALFGTRDLVATANVRLGAGSLTSVSLEGATLPYGTTIDGQQWRYDANPAGGNADLGAPPQKRIELGGANVALGDGARIDLSGGGDLQAVEWIPGTGGSRDVLSPFNTSYANGDSGQQVPLYPDQRGVYAIVPGWQSPVAATDAVFDKGASPVGIGQSVYLSGVPGLPDGVYTLLPAKYATLPGAFRVVQRTGTQDATPTQNIVAPDGTAVVSGRFVDALTGARDARSTLFDVQSRAVWGQYSEYTYTSANGFFAALAAKKGTAVPQLARDAGQIVLAATQQLQLGATLDTRAGPGGAGAQIDIASRALQVNDGDHAARDGYVQLDVADLNAFGGGSLLLGGTRQQTAEGTRIDVLADSVVVSNDAVDPLQAPEILLVAKAGGDAADGVHVDAGSVIEAKGALSASSVKPILIGQDADAAAGIAAISGDGALLRVSNAGEAPLIRRNVPAFGDAQGQLSVGAGAQLLGGASLTLDSTGRTRVSADALLRGTSIAANAGNVRFVDGAADPDADSLVIGATSLAQFADADRVVLRSYGSMDFIGDIRLDVDNALTLSAGAFTSDGGSVDLRADRLTLSNDLGAATAAGDPAVPGTGSLHLGGREVAFGGGDKSLSGFGSVGVDADAAVIVRDTGSFDFGALDVDLRAPVFIADAGADNTLRTGGTLTLARGAGTASTLAPLGGRITLIGGEIRSDATIRANSGDVTLQATDGDVRLDDGARVDVSGIEKTFFDISAFSPGGAIALVADAGDVRLAQDATLDFSASANGGSAGSLEIGAPTGTAQLLGTLDGAAPKGLGGSFALDIGGAVDLDALSGTLADSGIENAISIQTRTGNLNLSAGHTLKARDVTLIADGGADAQQRDAGNGNVVIDGTIDASGDAGGDIALWGRHGVAVGGSLLAKGSAADQRGGGVTIGTGGRSDGTLNADHGYQNVQAGDAGVIAIGAGAVIDVSGGSAGGLSGGTLDFRAPLLVDGDVNVTVADGATIRGAREVGLEAYAVWSTTDAGADPSRHFDGIIDPAGWYDAQGNLVAGTWTDRAGAVLPAPATPEQTADYLEKYFFTPDAANAAHSAFYGYLDAGARTPGTLMGFVQQPGFAFESRFANVANFRARAGIELRNPDPTINGGAISVLTSWNLASGASPDALDFRTGGNAPVLTLRAHDDVVVKASLSDGFYQLRNPYSAGGPSASQAQAQEGYQTRFDFYLNNLGVDIGSLVAMPEIFGDADQAEAQQYYGQYLQLLTLLFDKSQPELGATPEAPISLVDGFLVLYAPELGSSVQDFADQPRAPFAPTSPAGYAGYLSSYERYALDLFAYWGNTGFGALPTWSTPSLPVLGPVLPGSTTNEPTLQASLDNPLPLATASLIDGDSSRYRIVAGADFTSTLPDAFRRASGNDGDVVLDGHRRYQEPDQKDVLSPTVVRTGTGSIDIVAAHDLRFDDDLSPASVYTAGRPGAGTADGADVSILRGGANNPDVVVGAQANAEAAGDIDLTAGRDILGNRQLFDVDGSLTGIVGNYIGQYWWPWLQAGNPLADDGVTLTAAQINFGGFAQGVLSAGGNVSVDAGRDIRELSVSLPVSYVPTETGKTLYGGGNLDVSAGRDVLGGDYFVARGEGRLDAGGSLGSAFELQTRGRDDGGNLRDVTSAVDPVFALQDGHWTIQARGDAAIGAIVNPAYLVPREQFGFLVSTRATLDYGTTSSIAISALDGDVRINTLELPGELFNFGQRGGDGAVEVSNRGFDDVLPADFSATSLSGGLSIERAGRLYPSATGQLTLLADGDIQLYNGTAVPGTALSMLDAPGAYQGDDRPPTPLQKLNLHRDDDQPVRVYSLQGDIVGGFESGGFYLNPLTLDLPKPAQIRAGRDIVNLDLHGQNDDRSDVTSVVAGRDLYYTTIQGAPDDQSYRPRWGWLQIGGPGTFEVQAGRNLGPLTSANEALVLNRGGFVEPNNGGIRSIGNRENPGLSTDGADIAVRYGVAPGIDGAAFAARYLDPAAADTTDAYRAWLAAFVLQIENDARARDGLPALTALTPSAAWTAFQQLPAERRQLLVDRVFLDELKRVGEDYADPRSPDFNQYARGYVAIDTLFPSAFGYTANNLEGGENGAATQILTGDFDMRGSTVQTERGGDIRILGPGGGVQVGSVSAPPQVVDANGNVLIGPNQQGILAVSTGDVGLFSDASVQLAQSRIFTQRGGDLVIWSSNGDINAGKGAKTSSEKPKVTYVCDLDQFCFVNANGQVSGAGIATLQAAPGAKAGDAVLVAPRGTVDAGDAGIRIAGNLIVASQFVANADNIEVKGDSIGVASGGGVDSGALTAASSAASAVQDAAGDLAERRPTLARDLPALISVQVIGFGNCAPDDPRCKVNR